MWSQNVSRSDAAAVLGISDIYLSTVSNDKFTNSSGSSAIMKISFLDVCSIGNITSINRLVFDSLIIL